MDKIQPGIITELFWNYRHPKTLRREESHTETVDVSEIGCGITVELLWNYASQKHIKERKHEK